ncbi:uncharacterized protein BXZ73DRAFT_79126 [Epithele typhae]|uniref:uncharacterized protein n=1 Tax=Epithele typhae TaxID=378194 RepID=UPI00200879B2|nr:uncharacterized protein BXZ73DRAFT_79126 [Epithele typhae]KAH9924999.1 hypothetical protein BXZ73DRAFT_79126 [Epithele typhae]
MLSVARLDGSSQELTAIIVARLAFILADVFAISATWYNLGRAQFRVKPTIRNIGTLTDVFLRDGTLCFVVLTLLNIVHLVFFLVSINAQSGIATAINAFPEPLTSILMSRFLVHLQVVNKALSGNDTMLSGSHHTDSIVFQRVIGSLGATLPNYDEPGMDKDGENEEREDENLNEGVLVERDVAQRGHPGRATGSVDFLGAAGSTQTTFGLPNSPYGPSNGAQINTIITAATYHGKFCTLRRPLCSPSGTKEITQPEPQDAARPELDFRMRSRGLSLHSAVVSLISFVFALVWIGYGCDVDISPGLHLNLRVDADKTLKFPDLYAAWRKGSLRASFLSGPHPPRGHRDEPQCTSASGRPLHGIPILLKDNIATMAGEGMNTTAGSFALLSSIVPRDANVAAKVRATGATPLGKANLSEWSIYRGNNPFGFSGIGGRASSPYVPLGSP